MNTNLFAVTSNPLTQFVEPLAGAAVIGVPPFVASPIYNIKGVPQRGSGRFLIRAIRVITIENFGPEVNFFSSGVAQPGVTELADAFEARFGFTAAMGEQIGGTGLFRYYVDGLAIPFGDADAIGNANVAPSLHVVLQNIDLIAKAASVVGPPAAGQVKLTAWLEPRGFM